MGYSCCAAGQSHDFMQTLGFVAALGRDRSSPETCGFSHLHGSKSSWMEFWGFLKTNYFPCIIRESMISTLSSQLSSLNWSFTELYHLILHAICTSSCLFKRPHFTKRKEHRKCKVADDDLFFYAFNFLF